jgi:hypothetical protein
MGEAMRLNRTRMYWFIASTNSWYVITPLIIILWVDIAALTNGGPILPASLGLILLLGFFLWFDWYWSREAVRRAASSQPGHRKGSASFDEKGISASYVTGATAFVPWREFSGWKEGEGVFTITLPSGTFRVFSKRGLSEPELEQLRSLLRSQISGRPN